MTTTGEYLVGISTLTTGTALEHFLNISAGTGTGYPYPVDSIIAALEGDVLVVAESDEYSVTVDAEDISAEIATELDADLEGETTVNREC